MNCANHADASAVAYCRTCGKALCANCTRPVRGVIYCEDCLGARMEGGVPAGTAGFVSGGPSPTTFSSAASGQVPPPTPPPGSGSGPNPTVAGILAGFFPFGVGAVYTGQYAKGLAHLAIFVLLIAGCNSGGDVLPAISGIGIAFFVVYQIIDAVRSARAIQAGLPAPDPYGLGATFGGGAKIETSKIPMGAIVLILVGVLFMLHTMGWAEYGLDRFWPLILIALGAWLFARNWGALDRPGCSGCQCARCRTRRIMGPVMLLTIGFLFFLDHSLHVARFHQTWPVILLAVGVVKLLQGSASGEGHIPPSGPGASSGGGPIPPVPPVPPAPPAVPTGEVSRG
jgi:hypothetical protein